MSFKRGDIIRSIFDKPDLSKLQFIEYSKRFYGEPKLILPKELKGIKQWDSVDYIPKKCKCAIYIKGNDVWIKHRDYFSQEMKLPPEDFGMPLEVLANKYCDKQKKNKFIYPDCWGSIVLRNEAWLCFKNLITVIENGVFIFDIKSEILRQMEKHLGFEEYELDCGYMERMLEKLIKMIKEKFHREGICIQETI